MYILCDKLLSHLLNAETESLSGGLNSWEGLSPPGETEASGNAVRKPLVDGSPVRKDPQLDLRALHAADVSDDVVDKVVTIDVVHDCSVERTWLFKVKLGDFAQIPVSTTDPFLVLSIAFSISSRTVDRTLVAEVCQRGDGALVVGAGTLVVDGHEAVALEVSDRNSGLINRNLSVVGTKSVAVGIWVGEEARLQDRVTRWLKVGDSVGGREGNLFNLGEVVLNIFVQHELADRAQGELLVRPDLGEIQNIVAEAFCLLGSHCLNRDCPRGVFSCFDGFEERLDTVVWVFTAEPTCGGAIEGLETTVGDEVDLCVDPAAIGLDELVGVAGVAVHVVVTIGGATIGEEDGDLMSGLWILCQVVPEHIRIFQVSLGVTLLGVDEVGEFGGIPDEEDRSVVEHPVKVALLRSDLEGKAAGITGGIRRSEFTTDSGESDGGTMSLAELGEELGRGNVAEVVGQFKVTMCASTLGVNDTLWDTLTIKVGEEINVVEVLEKEGANGANALSCVWLCDSGAV
jgi:hypothetical protein